MAFTLMTVGSTVRLLQPVNENYPRC